MGGMNEADRLRAKGVDAKKASVTRLPISAFTIVTRGPLAHPRRHLPIDPELRGHILASGIPSTFKAREQGGPNGSTVFEVIDGARRLKAGLDAEAELQRTAPRKPPLTWDKADPSDPGRLYVDVELVACSDAELLLERLAANRGGLPDAPSVLAAIVAGLLSLKCDDYAEIAKRMPRGIGPKDVAALGRWRNLVPEAQERFDAGDPWARRMSPKAVSKLGDIIAELPGTKAEKDRAWLVAAGMWLAINRDPHGTLELLPVHISQAISDARQKGRKA